MGEVLDVIKFIHVLLLTQLKVLFESVNVMFVANVVLFKYLIISGQGEFQGNRVGFKLIVPVTVPNCASENAYIIVIQV